MIKLLKNSLIATILITTLYLVLFYPLVLIEKLELYDLLLVTLSISPGFLIMVIIYNLDKYDKEPLWLLAIAFIFGAVNLYIAIDVQEYALSFNTEGNELFKTAREALTISISEEFLKFLVILIFIYPSKHFDEPFDGIVYCVFAGMGFATVENLTFVMQASSSLAFLRMVSAIPAHFVFSVIMGYYIGKAKSAKKLRFLYILMGLLIPIIFHGLYDYFLFLDYIPGIWIGGIVTLILALYISKNSILAHIKSSPFIGNQESN